MFEILKSWIIENGLETLSLFVALGSLIATVIIARRVDLNGRKPTLVFEFSDDGWIVENVGNGPAINALISSKEEDEEWSFAIRIPPLAKGKKLEINKIINVNSNFLAISYTDSTGLTYSTVCHDDFNNLEKGNILAGIESSKIGRYWAINI